MMGTMLQDELNAITVGIFLQVESGYMTWLNYRLLDTLWSCRGVCGSTASALLCTCNTHRGTAHWEIQPGVDADSCRQLLVVLEKHRLKTRKTTTEECQYPPTTSIWCGLCPPCPQGRTSTPWERGDDHQTNMLVKEQVVVFCTVLFSTCVPLVKLGSQREYRPTCLTPAGHL